MKFAHGDVILNKVAKLPSGVKPKKGHLLQEGEHTGHAHRLWPTVGKTAEESFRLHEKDGELFAEIIQITALRHEEHKEILLAPGNYKVGIIKEFDPFEKVIRNVVD